MPLILRPLSDRVVVVPDSPAKLSSGGIYIPDTAEDKPQIGTIKWIGPGKISETPVVTPGSKLRSPPEIDKIEFPRQPMVLKVGDRILFGKYSGVEIEIGRDKVLVLRQTDVLAIVEEA